MKNNNKTYEPSNKPTAELRIAILKYVMKYDYYPHDWRDLDELEKRFMADEIGHEEYDAELEKMRNEWLPKKKKK